MNLIGKIEKVGSKYTTVFVQPASACGAHYGSCGGCPQEGRQIKVKSYEDYSVGWWLEFDVDDTKALHALLTSAVSYLYFSLQVLFHSLEKLQESLSQIISILVGSIIVKLLESVRHKIEYPGKNTILGYTEEINASQAVFNVKWLLRLKYSPASIWVGVI